MYGQHVAESEAAGSTRAFLFDPKRIVWISVFGAQSVVQAQQGQGFVWKMQRFLVTRGVERRQAAAAEQRTQLAPLSNARSQELGFLHSFVRLPSTSHLHD